MKKIYTTIVTLFLGLSVFATDYRFGSSITVRSLDRDDIEVVINGKRYDARTNVMVFDDLRPGMHKIKIFKEKDGFRGGFGKRHIKKMELVYAGTVHVKPGSHVTITIDRFNRSKVEVVKVHHRGTPYRNKK